jgi:hypothetical protein
MSTRALSIATLYSTLFSASAAVARALLLAETAPQQVATLIALRQGGDPARRLWALIGGVGAGLVNLRR